MLISTLSRGRRGLLLLVLSLWLLGTQTSCHRYRIPSPTGPPQPKVKKAATGDANQSADGRVLENSSSDLKIQHNSYDKNGLLKKKKYERRRLKHKVGQRKFMGIVLPF